MYILLSSKLLVGKLDAVGFNHYGVVKVIVAMNVRGRKSVSRTYTYLQHYIVRVNELYKMFTFAYLLSNTFKISTLM